MSAVDNMLRHQPARYGAGSVNPSDWHYERAQILRNLKDVDVADYACDASVLTAVKTGNAELVGRVLMAAINASMDRCADLALGMAPRSPDAEDAAAAELQRDYSPVLKASIEHAGGRA